MFEIVFIGIFVGFLSGFFGIGGGTILIPALLFLGFNMKAAVGISVMQMIFSSVYGSYLNKKKGSLDSSLVLFIGIGGFIGGLLGGKITSVLDAKVLEYIFLGFIIFALIRLFFETKSLKDDVSVSKLILFSIGLFLGAFSMMIGVGGSIVLVPVLVGFFHVELKKAIAAGLFFVIFSSVSGFLSHLMNGHIDLMNGFIVGFASLVGVYFGIHYKEIIENSLQKKLLIGFYLIVLGFFVKRLFFI